MSVKTLSPNKEDFMFINCGDLHFSISSLRTEFSTKSQYLEAGGTLDSVTVHVPVFWLPLGLTMGVWPLFLPQ